VAAEHSLALLPEGDRSEAAGLSSLGARDENSRYFNEPEGQGCRIQFDSTKSAGSALFWSWYQFINPSLFR
jgi:hypothetical protein